MVTSEVALGALELLEIDACGFDKMDRAILSAIIDKFDGGPVGVETLAAAVGEEADTIGDVYEPYLLQEGFIARAARGRIATQRAYTHLGRTRPRDVALIGQDQSFCSCAAASRWQKRTIEHLFSVGTRRGGAEGNDRTAVSIVVGQRLRMFF